MKALAVACASPELENKARVLAQRYGLPFDNQAPDRLLLTEHGLQLCLSPFLPMQADFQLDYWQKRRAEGKKQGLVRACRPVPGMRIVDATAGWGRDAAVLASFGADVLMLERHPVMAALLEDALARQDEASKQALRLSLVHADALSWLQALPASSYPDIIYLDPMHPTRQKAALVKKDLQALQQMIGADEQVLELIQLARQRVLKKVVVKWPQHSAAVLKPGSSIEGKTVRFDMYPATIV